MSKIIKLKDRETEENLVLQEFNGNTPMGNIIVEGISSKNMFNKNSVSVGWLNSNNVVDDDSSWRYSDYIEVLPNTKYTVSGGTDGSRALAICFYDSSKNFISGTSHNGASIRTYTTPNNCYYIRESLNAINLNTFMIEKGSTATSYSKYINFNMD